MAVATWFFTWHGRCNGGLMPKIITIKITYDEPTGEDLAAQEIKETINALRNSLVSQVGGVVVDITEE